MTKPQKNFPAACGGREGFISCRPSYKVRWQNCTAYTLSHKLFRCSGEAPRGPIKAQHSTVSVVPLIIPFTNIFWKVKQKFRNSCDLKILTVSCFFFFNKYQLCFLYITILKGVKYVRSVDGHPHKCHDSTYFVKSVHNHLRVSHSGGGK